MSACVSGKNVMILIFLRSYMLDPFHMFMHLLFFCVCHGVHVEVGSFLPHVCLGIELSSSGLTVSAFTQ